MSTLRYDLASVAVYDPIAMNRNATRNVLFALGFREIESYATLEDVKRAVTSRDFDLIVLEAAKPEDPVYEFVRQFRRGKVARNPFSVVIVATWLPESQLVRRVLDCGADDLICRPFSTNQLAERIRTHAMARKGFVVTSDYIGPDRRKDDQRGSQIKLIDVLNSLKLKSVDAMDGPTVEAIAESAIAEGRKIVNAERMRRLAFHLGVVAGFVLSCAENLAENGVRRSDLEKIIETATEFLALAETERAESSVKTAMTMIEVAQKCLTGEDMARHAKLMVRLSIALQVMLTPGLNENACRAELDDTLERIRARGRRS